MDTVYQKKNENGIYIVVEDFTKNSYYNDYDLEDRKSYTYKFEAIKDEDVYNDYVVEEEFEYHDIYAADVVNLKSYTEPNLVCVDKVKLVNFSLKLLHNSR